VPVTITKNETSKLNVDIGIDKAFKNKIENYLIDKNKQLYPLYQKHFVLYCPYLVSLMPSRCTQYATQVSLPKRTKYFNQHY